MFRGMKFEDFEAINITHLQKGKVIWTIQAPLLCSMLLFQGVHEKGCVTSWFIELYYMLVDFGKSKGRPQVVGFLNT